MNVSVNSYFSGAGLMDYGLMKAGIEINRAYEIDEKACRTYRHNFGDKISQCDIGDKLALDEPECDGMVFTYPCNKYSNSASIHNQRTGDELFLHALRHVALNVPNFYAIENVPGMKRFAVTMEAMTKLPDYYVQVFCPIESSLWLPQKRSRLIIVGTLNPFTVRPPKNHKPITLAECLERDVEINHDEAVHKRLAGAKGYRDAPIISDPARGDIAPCVLAHYKKDRSTRLVVDKNSDIGVRSYTAREMARLQGLPDSFEFPVTERQALEQIGNGVSVPVAEWIGREMNRYMGADKTANPFKELLQGVVL